MRPARGFTLVEVLVALVIVAFGVGALMAALTSTADTTARRRDATLAEWIGFNQIATARLELQQPTAGTSTGDLDFAGSHWGWEQTVTEMDIPGLMRLTVRVKRSGVEGSSGGGEANVPWAATVTGFKGDALNASSGQSVNWNGVPATPGPPAPDPNANPGANPGAPPGREAGGNSTPGTDEGGRPRGGGPPDRLPITGPPALP